jgi:hypothetical protein
MNHLRLLSWSGAACLLLTVSVAASAQRSDKDTGKDMEARRPKLTLTARPIISMAPARVVLTAELQGGANDFEDFYCASTEWDWGDGTQSEATSDCEPYEPGKSEIKRRFTVEHVFRTGAYKVMFRLKRHDKVLSAATVSIQVRPGLRDGDRE